MVDMGDNAEISDVFSYEQRSIPSEMGRYSSLLKYNTQAEERATNNIFPLPDVPENRHNLSNPKS
jgi:hypothetical protein